MRKILIPFILLTGLLLLGTSQARVINIGDLTLSFFNNSASPKTTEDLHFFQAANIADKGLPLFSKVVDSEEEENKHSAKQKQSAREIFHSSAAYFFGYISGQLARQASQDYVSKAKYLLLEAFRL
jgi:hypothetical protein